MSLAEDARNAKDTMGWAPMPAKTDGDTADEFTQGAIDLGDVVMRLAHKVEALERALEVKT